MGASLSSPSSHYLRVGDFALGDSILGLVFGSLYPLLHQSLDWFRFVRKVLRRESIGFEVRSSNLEIGLSCSVGTAGVETDSATSVPSSFLPSISASPRSFHALKEKFFLKEDTFSRFRDIFQFLEETRVRLPRKGEKSCAFTHGEVCFYETVFLCGLRFAIHPFIMELLHYLNIAPR